MGAWLYCNNCERGMDRPAMWQTMTEVYRCPDCGTNHDGMVGSEEDIADVWKELEEALKTVEAQEKRIEVLEAGMKAILSGKIKIGVK